MAEWLLCEQCNGTTLHDVSNFGAGIKTVCEDCHKVTYYVDENLLGGNENEM